MCVYVSGSKAPLLRPVGLFGRGLSVDLPLLLLLLVRLGASASENVAWDERAATPDLFTFFFLLALPGNHHSQSKSITSKATTYHVRCKPALSCCCYGKATLPGNVVGRMKAQRASHLASISSGSVSERVGSERNFSSPEELIAADTLKRPGRRKDKTIGKANQADTEL